ncbi:MAG: SUMF1/EgtB/PvdO family nonheme iron enzyme [Bacteroidales bacterium]|nr:SUMF1/EgtB/PvdO family nonheme iron enzyme [Bacteroidales bacterium]MBN2634052.1 SUMF1/EgtB/PvdO family nonheme iron enzyme [Bacteroidales bacterium]
MFRIIRALAASIPGVPVIPVFLLAIISQSVCSQSVQYAGIDRSRGLALRNFTTQGNMIITLSQARPLFSFLADGKPFTSTDAEVVDSSSYYCLIYDNDLAVAFSTPEPESGSWTALLSFENRGQDTVTISNVVPFGEDPSSFYITGYGPPGLARAALFRPGFRPLRVILPDNAWEMGYSSFSAGNGISVCAIARRQLTEGGERRRYETVLPPGSKVKYIMYAETYQGEWQNGMRLMFRDRYLYDLKEFDNSLYERSDLAWIKESYLIILQMAWDIEFYDRQSGRYNYGEYLKKGIERFGYPDVMGIRPTWPRLGLDERNQWDLYRDLPGGTTQLRNFARLSRPYGTRFFIAYNPWDNSTRKEDHLRGMAKLIQETEADGVVLDTRGNSSYELQAAADSVRKGVVMFSEGMAITRDMPGIISGRVHNAIYYSPELNLNKLIKPDFSIFRVCDVGEDVLHREIAIAFFNGYGTELNMFRPGGRNENYESDLDYLALTTFTLRQNNDAFLDKDWTPLLETMVDNIYVNKWNSGEKTLFTILNMRHEGFSGRLFKTPFREDRHYVSLWNHENILPSAEGDDLYISSTTGGWLAGLSGTRMEGSVDCIAELPDILQSRLEGDSIKLMAPAKGRVFFWKGNPSYKTENRQFRIVSDTAVCVRDLFGYYEGKIVIQLLDGKILKDENVINIKGGKPRLVSRTERTERADLVPDAMVLVPGGTFTYDVSTSEDFIPYPTPGSRQVTVDTFLIDRYPVTNARYYEFITKSGYVPADTVNYLRHWGSVIYRQGQDNYPVVYVSYEDMKAYAAWAGKRLPTEDEWQLAAQGTDGRKWPWGNDFHGTNCNNAFGRPTPVDAFPKGQSQAGVMDLVGNVWQMTNDMYFNGTNYITVIRGGSYYNPDSSWWYIKGGPQSLDRTQIMLLVSPGYDRSSTVGFRCVKDVSPGVRPSVSSRSR